MANYECLYCGHKFTESTYTKTVKCNKCGDKNLKKEKEYQKIDYYTDKKDETTKISLEDWEDLFGGNTD